MSISTHSHLPWKCIFNVTFQNSDDSKWKHVRVQIRISKVHCNSFGPCRPTFRANLDGNTIGDTQGEIK